MQEEQRRKEEADRLKREKDEADRFEKERLAKLAAAMDTSGNRTTTTTANPTTTRTATSNPTTTRTATTTLQPRTGTTSANLEPPVVGSDEPGLVLVLQHQEPPQYPRSLRRTGIRKSGTVRLMVLIGANGVPESVRPLAGDRVFYSEAIKAVEQWRWAPPKRNGQAVRVTYVVAVNF
jgi:TonB family protein